MALAVLSARANPLTAESPLTALGATLENYGLMGMGSLHLKDAPGPETLVLLGTSATFWEVLTKSPEYSSNMPDPVDRWSLRALPEIAKAFGAKGVLYPFGGPPYQPFIAWAKQTGAAFDSPVGMLVHHTAGMMISYRGALVFDGHHSLLQQTASSPCDSCPDRPCEAACPVDALSADHAYDVPRCKAHIAAPEGADCMAKGCAVRRACPLSQRFDRPQAQSAHHMRAFLGET
jgi:hypothetical protein